MKAKKYNVIWFDDEFVTLEDIREKASINDIILKGYSNAKDGIRELEKNLLSYDAAIVDGIFYANAEQSGDALNDKPLAEVAMAFERLSNKKKLPWFILSGQLSFTREINRYADGLKDNQVYDKLNNSHLEKLWVTLKHEADQQPETQIRHKYQRAFEVCSEKYIGAETANVLLYLLSTVESTEENNNTEDKLNAIRKIIDRLFDTFNRVGVLPIEVLRGTGSINNSSKFLAGLHPSYKYSKEILHPSVAYLLRNILNLTQDGSHANDDLDLKADEFIKKQTTPYLFNSVIFQLLDILIWFKNFADSNQDIEKNKEFATLNATESSINYEGVIEQDTKNNFHCGVYLLNYNLVTTKYKVGDKIKIMETSDNSQPKSSHLYAKFATKFIKL